MKTSTQERRVGLQRTWRVALALLWLGLPGAVAVRGLEAAASGQQSAQAASSIPDAPVGPVLTTTSGLIAAGQFDRAESRLRAEIAGHPNLGDARFLLAYVLLRENKPTQSLAEYTEAAKLRLPSAEDFKDVALDYALIDALPQADRWIGKSIEMDPKDADAWYVAGRIRYERKRYQDAADFFSKALVLAPGNVKAENNLGLAYEGLGRTDDSIAAYRQAIAWQEQAAHPSEQPLLNLGIAMLHKGDLEGAVQLLTGAAAIAPSEPKIHEQLGSAYLQQNRADKAQKEFETALAVTPKSAALHFLLGQAYRRQGLQGQAKAEFAESAALSGAHSTPDQH